MHELIAPGLNFTLLVILLVYFTRKPVKEMVRNRRDAIKTMVDEAAAQKSEAEKKFREFSDRLNAFESEAKAALDRAREEGETLKARIIKDAQASAERIIRDAEASSAANLNETKDQIRRETIAKAVDLAEKMIRDRLSSDDQRRIVDEYVGKVAHS
jgi:F-type H+-transporting ATPase subunit b